MTSSGFLQMTHKRPAEGAKVHPCQPRTFTQQYAAMAYFDCRVRRRNILGVALAVSALILAATPATAGDKQARERKARTACLNGNYTLGVSLLSELFVDSKDPTYIFNQGRCFEQNRRYEDAIARFEEYLQVGETSASHLSPDDKDAAEKHIAKCKKFLAEQPSSSPLLAPPPSSPAVSVSPAMPETAARPEPVAQAIVPAQHELPLPAGETGSGLRAAGIITASFGAAAVVAGVLFTLKANSIVNDFETKPGSYTTGQDSSRKTYSTLSWVGYGVGAASIATGAVLFGTGFKAGKRAAATVALLPAMTDGHTGVSLIGGF